MLLSKEVPGNTNRIAAMGVHLLNEAGKSRTPRQPGRPDTVWKDRARSILFHEVLLINNAGYLSCGPKQMVGQINICIQFIRMSNIWDKCEVNKLDGLPGELIMALRRDVYTHPEAGICILITGERWNDNDDLNNRVNKPRDECRAFVQVLVQRCRLRKLPNVNERLSVKCVLMFCWCLQVIASKVWKRQGIREILAIWNTVINF